MRHGYEITFYVWSTCKKKQQCSADEQWIGTNNGESLNKRKTLQNITISLTGHIFNPITVYFNLLQWTQGTAKF